MAGKKGANRLYTDDELLEHLRAVERATGHPATERLLASRGHPSPGTYKHRFGSLVEARRRAGCSPSRRGTLTPEQLLADLREVCDAMDGIPSRLEFRRRKGYPAKRFDDAFGRGGWPDALRRVGRDPRRTQFEPEELLREVRRLAASALPGKPAGVAPSYSDVEKWSGYSTTPFERCFGSVDAAVRAADLTPAPRVRRDIRQRLVDFAIRFAKRNGFPPNSADFGRARLWSTAITRNFGSISGLLLEAGLDPNDSAGHLMAARGRDGLLYDTRGERRVADLLFDAMLHGYIDDYIPHQAFSTRGRWEVDFAVRLNDGNTVLVEYDGYHPARRKFAFSVANARTEALRELGLPLWLVVPDGSTHEYEPYYGERIVLDALEARLRAQSQRTVVRPDHLEAPGGAPRADLGSLLTAWQARGGAGSVRPTAGQESLVTLPYLAAVEGISLAHAAFLHRRGELKDAGWEHVRSGWWEPMFREDEARSDVRRILTALASSVRYLSAPQMAEKLGISHSTLVRCVRSGTIVPEIERSGRRIVYFDVGRLGELRQQLGMLDHLPPGHIDARELAERAGVTVTTVNGLATSGFITPAGEALIRGRHRRYFSETEVDRVRARFGGDSIPSGLLTSADLAQAAKTSRTTILRLVRTGHLVPVQTIVLRGTPTHVFLASSVEEVRRATPRSRR